MGVGGGICCKRGEGGVEPKREIEKRVEIKEKLREEENWKGKNERKVELKRKWKKGRTEKEMKEKENRDKNKRSRIEKKDEREVEFKK